MIPLNVMHGVQNVMHDVLQCDAWCPPKVMHGAHNGMHGAHKLMLGVLQCDAWCPTM